MTKNLEQLKKVISMCPFAGLDWEDSEGRIFRGGSGLTEKENNRLDEYFGKFYGKAFSRECSVELAQMALDNVKIPNDWQPFK